MQAQLKFCSADYCDFAVWREGELLVLRIYLDKQFITAALNKCEQIIEIAILPEILGKWYSKEPVLKPICDENNGAPPQESRYNQLMLWCYCRNRRVRL